ncbi:MAG: BLUF domain-containing protein [Spirochaetaceae bacterium]|nr:BLUF domain-containing protein [Myxococcales bacterium]MCB9723089.1 BLUF domain-containing protein [Spirochaetaceae bacterium]HPG24858.1 BLUF domain-containing protein [Myxococcota bacterium]
MLTRLLYASRSTAPIDERLVQGILEQARTHNLEHGITGVLCIDPTTGLFLQVLEGSRTAVNRLYANIVRDPRHTDVELLHFTEIAERHFSGWRMGSVDLHKVNRSAILRFSETARLDPHAMTGTAALALIQELTSTAAIGSRDGH